MTWLSRGVAVCCVMVLATRASAQIAGLGEMSATSDADSFDALRLRAGAMFRYASPFDYAGAAAQTSRYSQSEWNRDAPAVLFVWRKQRRDTLAGTVGEVGLVRIGGRARLIGDATWSLRPSPRTGVEFLVAGDLVETRRALDRGTAHTFAGISAEREVTDRFTVIGLAGYQRFTDGNERLHLRGRLIWSLFPKHGVTAQLRWRQFGSEQLDVDNAYFNPDRYAEWQAALAIRKRHAGWQWYGVAAAGQEEINRSVTHATALLELRAETTLRKDVRLVLRASYNRSAGFASVDDYWYRVAGVSVIVPF